MSKLDEIVNETDIGGALAAGAVGSLLGGVSLLNAGALAAADVARQKIARKAALAAEEARTRGQQ